MDRNKLFHVLVLGGTALIGGCSSADAPAATPPTDSGTADGLRADTTTTEDGAKPDTTPSDVASEVLADSISSFDAPGDAATCEDMSVCKWDGGIPFCDGMCCIWGSEHPCCAPFMAKDGGS